MYLVMNDQENSMVSKNSQFSICTSLIPLARHENDILN